MYAAGNIVTMIKNYVYIYIYIYTYRERERERETGREFRDDGSGRAGKG